MLNAISSWMTSSTKRELQGRIENARKRLEEARQVDKEACAVLDSLQVEREKNHFAAMIELALKYEAEEEMS